MHDFDSAVNIIYKTCKYYYESIFGLSLLDCLVLLHGYVGGAESTVGLDVMHGNAAGCFMGGELYRTRDVCVNVNHNIPPSLIPSVPSLGWFMSNQETGFVTTGQRLLTNPIRYTTYPMQKQGGNCLMLC